MTVAESFFAQSYAEARAQFLARCASASAGLAVASHAHPLPGRDGEVLAMDVARSGPADAAAVLLISSACHGAEGFCGSGVQNALLADATFLHDAAAAGVAVLLVHGLNPHGFSWLRRVTHEGVDLNRNFLDFNQPLPANPGYDALAAALVPATWPPTAADEALLTDYARQHGPMAQQTAITSGQNTHPDGLFFSGTGPTWSQLALRAVLREHGRNCQRLGWIDLHTGLGPSGHGERIFAGPDDDHAAIARAKAWWGDEVTSTSDGSSSSAPLKGLMWHAAAQECPQAEVTSMALEYGTLPINEVLMALRADHWLVAHPGHADAAQAQAIKRQLRDAFYVDTPGWKAAIVEQGVEAARQALKGLAAAPQGVPNTR